MSRKCKNIFNYLNAALLRRLLVLLSMPLFATACHVPQQVQSGSMAADTTRQMIVIVPKPIDTIIVKKADTLIPVYECPVITPCYGVVATPILQESIEYNFEIPEL
ncbi:MAG: hypothetical protein A2W93_01805 [Bacteroidetes bacterium GWF2_43_63]|nr:MAG: hypothetical protein A2W94_10270 [Bacteroidetes bacterium GWE2_42_42]OFY55799.1 MAG: hypothetical protein A2W93_01805 [Bacteroidetes bacterium GWF2_43_63]HBG71281.1 hypothetical protein [Bacteroidales bacterium]HCB60498.1 hypothetical protein [Bacteroidales bacterium]HCY22545.1 hypothetical protein [Bacteroidales bacterium]